MITKKTVVYIATAILLGVVAMLPVMVLTPEKIPLGYYDAEANMCFLLEGDAARLKEQYGLAKAPLGALPLGVIIALSFIFAFGVSFYLKTRI